MKVFLIKSILQGFKICNKVEWLCREKVDTERFINQFHSQTFPVPRIVLFFLLFIACLQKLVGWRFPIYLCWVWNVIDSITDASDSTRTLFPVYGKEERADRSFLSSSKALCLFSFHPKKDCLEVIQHISWDISSNLLIKGQKSLTKRRKLL